jgi:hypothetical protein
VLPALIAAFLACALSGVLIWKETIPVRLPEGIEKALVALKDRDMTSELDHEGIPFGPSCRGMGGSAKRTLFFGDSNAMQYESRIWKLLQDPKRVQRGAMFLAKYGVPPIPRMKRSDADPYFSNLCPDCEEVLRNFPEIDRVVIAARWNLYFDSNTQWLIQGHSLKEPEGRRLALAALGNFIRKIREGGKEVILILNIPTGWDLHPKSLFERTFSGVSFHPESPYALNDFVSGNGGFLNDLRVLAQSSGAVVIDPAQSLSERGVCIFKDSEGIPIRYDADHLRPGYVREHVKYLDFTVEP